MFNPDFSALVQASERPDISLGSDNFMTYAPPKDPPRVRLQRKIAESNLLSQEEKRAADSAAMPFILRDMQSKQRAEIEKAEALQSQLDQAQRALQAPIPTREVAQMSQGQMIAAILGSILNPRGTNQTIDQMQGFAQQREDLNFENQMRQYGLRMEDGQALLQHLTRQLSGAQDAARDYEKMGYDYQQNAERLAQDQLQFNAAQTLQREIAGMKGEQAQMNRHYDGYYKGKDLGVRHAAWRAITAAGDYSLPEPTMPTYEEDLGRAKIATEGSKQKDINNKIYWRNKETPAKIQNMLASKGLKEAQTKRIAKITSMLDDEFALKYATAMGRLAVAQQNADSYANSKNKVDTGATLNEMRLLLNSQLDALTGQLALADDDAERESIELRLSAVGQELLNLNRQNIGAGQNTGAGLLDGPHMESTGGGADEVAGKKEADEIRAYINTLPASQRKQATLDARAELKKKYKGRNFGI